MLISACLFVSIYFPNVQKLNDLFFIFFISPFIIEQITIVFLPPASSFNPIVGPSTNKPYPPAILVKHSTWFLKNADLFICHDHVLYGVHQSLFNQSPLFREIIHYGESNEIGTATIIRQLVTFRRRLIPPPFRIMTNSFPVYRVFDEQERLSRRIRG
jgi:hypothetical protein